MWLLGTVAVSCIYPELESSPDWRGEQAAAGESSTAGNGGSTSAGGAPGEAGRAPSEAGNGGTPEPGEGGASGAPGDGTIVVTVVDQNRQPYVGATVWIDDIELTTDAEGQASIPGAELPSYRLTFVDDIAKSVSVYDEVTRRRLYFTRTRLPGDGGSATIEGTITTNESEKNLQVSFVDESGAFRFFGARNFTDMAPTVRYTITPMWTGPELSGSVVALNWVSLPGSSAPSAYFFGSQPTTIADETIVTALDFTLLELKSRQLQVDISSDPGTTRNDFLVLGAFTAANQTATGVVDYAIPDDASFDAIAGATKQMITTCNFGGSEDANSSIFTVITDDLTSIAEDCPPIPKLLAPDDEAVMVAPSAPLQMLPAEPGCNGFNITLLGAGWTINAWTTTDQVTLPDLSALGIDYAGQNVTWTTSTTAPCDSLDFLLPPPGTSPTGNGTQVTFGRSGRQTFTFSP